MTKGADNFSRIGRADLSDFFLHWHLFDDYLIEDMIILSRNTEIDPEKDELTQDFAVGRQLDVLFGHCCSAFAALPTSSLMLELDFMTLKVE